MKIALLADIHGNYPALRAVLNDIKLNKPDKVIVLGDLVFKGPQPEKCVEAVRDLRTTVIRGNIDELVGRGVIQPGFAKSADHEAAILHEMEWTRDRLSEEQLVYLSELPFMHDEQLTQELKLRCVHANPQNILDSIWPDAPVEDVERMFVGTDAAIVAYGHIHQPYIRNAKGRTLVNTGSVGLPFDGNARSSYAMIEADGPDYSITLRRVSYDIEETVRAYEGSGHPYADSVIAAIRSGTAPR